MDRRAIVFIILALFAFGCAAQGAAPQNGTNQQSLNQGVPPAGNDVTSLLDSPVPYQCTLTNKDSENQSVRFIIQSMNGKMHGVLARESADGWDVLLDSIVSDSNGMELEYIRVAGDGNGSCTWVESLTRLESGDQGQVFYVREAIKNKSAEPALYDVACSEANLTDTDFLPLGTVCTRSDWEAQNPQANVSGNGWADAAPFSITRADVVNGTVQLVLANRGNDTVAISGLEVDGVNVSNSDFGNPASPGGSTTLSFRIEKYAQACVNPLSGPPAVSSITVYYESPTVGKKSQTGPGPLYLNCS